MSTTNPTSLEFVQGDTVNLTINWTDTAGSPVDLTGSTIVSSIKKEYNTAVLLSFTFDASASDLPAGLIVLTLTSTETAGLPPRTDARITSYVFDVNVTYANGDVATPVYGYLKMQRQVT